MLCPGVLMNTNFHLQHPERAGIDTSDAELIQKYLDQTYSTRFSIKRCGYSETDSFCSHTRIDVGAYALEEIRHSGEVRVRADRMTSVVALHVLHGRVECHYGDLTGVAGPGEWVLASTGFDGVRVRLKDAHVRSVVLNRSLLAEAAGDSVDGDPELSVIRFTGLTPTNGTIGGTLAAAERFVGHVLVTHEPHGTPILLESAGRMLAGAVLAAFPNELPSDLADDTDGDSHPLLLRQAVDYIQENAARDIGIGDIAAAVYLTPRTVQYMFRRHLGTTPTAYLRDVRLSQARHDLIAGYRGLTTVAETAARWGFAHTGRFAVLYRNTYGESPHETLRR